MRKSVRTTRSVPTRRNCCRCWIACVPVRRHDANDRRGLACAGLRPFAARWLRQAARFDLTQQLLGSLGETVAGAVEIEHRGRAFALGVPAGARAWPGAA